MFPRYTGVFTITKYFALNLYIPRYTGVFTITKYFALNLYIPRYTGVFTITKYFALNLYISLPLINKYLSVPLLLVLLSACTELLISAPKILTFLPTPPLGCEKLPFESNPILYPEYLYLSISSFFVKVTAPNK